MEFLFLGVCVASVLVNILLTSDMACLPESCCHSAVQAYAHLGVTGVYEHSMWCGSLSPACVSFMVAPRKLTSGRPFMTCKMFTKLIRRFGGLVPVADSCRVWIIKLLPWLLCSTFCQLSKESWDYFNRIFVVWSWPVFCFVAAHLDMADSSSTCSTTR